MAGTFSFSGFEYVEAAVAVDEVDEAAGIHFHVVGLGGRLAAARLRDGPADFLRRERVADVDDAQPAGEPRAVDERGVDMLLELVRAETPALARPRRVELADLEMGDQLDAVEMPRRTPTSRPGCGRMRPSPVHTPETRAPRSCAAAQHVAWDRRPG